MHIQPEIVDATKALLTDSDDPEHLEYLPQFDYLAAQQRFQSFISELQHRTGMAFATETVPRFKMRHSTVKPDFQVESRASAISATSSP